MEESINNLRNIAENLVASQSHVEKQLTKMEKEGMISVSCTNLNINETGTYSIRPFGVTENFLAFCDFKDFYNLGGGWTVFQHRFNGTVDFYQNWTMYKHGFGDVHGEHWLGLEKLHLMTKSGRHEMLVIVEDHEGNTAYALYDSFQIGSEAEKYKLTVGNYSGTAGDSLKAHNGGMFSTFDQDNDNNSGLNCAQSFNGAWWFNVCYYSHLNGKYRRKGEHLNSKDQGVIWYHWKGTYSHSLKSSKMMVRRRSE
uniref:Fibrinogen C-terminal domain-containing protein n=1 Tax=Anopheles atroparvus TaxID=41427 RepID=A0AAG5DKW9_ANOAO